MRKHRLRISQKQPPASRNAVTGGALGLPVGLDILPLRTEVWNAKMRPVASSPVSIFRTMPFAHDGTCGGRRQSRRGDPLDGLCRRSTKRMVPNTSDRQKAIKGLSQES
jgi:hypothetical protein